MTKHQKEVLSKLSKEQLIYLIEQFYHSQFLIGETLVDVSKCHIDAERAIIDIRKFMYDIPGMNDVDELKAHIDMKMGKITVEEYRRMMGFDD